MLSPSLSSTARNGRREAQDDEKCPYACDNLISDEREGYGRRRWSGAEGAVTWVRARLWGLYLASAPPACHSAGRRSVPLMRPALHQAMARPQRARPAPTRHHPRTRPDPATAPGSPTCPVQRDPHQVNDDQDQPDGEPGEPWSCRTPGHEQNDQHQQAAAPSTSKTKAPPPLTRSPQAFVPRAPVWSLTPPKFETITLRRRRQRRPRASGRPSRRRLREGRCPCGGAHRG